VDDLVVLADALGTVPSGLLRERDMPDDNDKLAQHEEVREEAVWALRACEKAEISRYEIVEWMDMVDRLLHALPTVLPHLFRDNQNPLEHAMRQSPTNTSLKPTCVPVNVNSVVPGRRPRRKPKQPASVQSGPAEGFR
jgi:hypothetical protein